MNVGRLYLGSVKQSAGSPVVDPAVTVQHRQHAYPIRRDGRMVWRQERRGAGYALRLPLTGGRKTTALVIGWMSSSWTDLPVLASRQPATSVAVQ